MTLGSVFVERPGRQDALSGRPKVAIVNRCVEAGSGLEMGEEPHRKGFYRVVANSRKITSAMTLHSTADLKLVGRRHWYRGNGQNMSCVARFRILGRFELAGEQRRRLYSQAFYRVHRR